MNRQCAALSWYLSGAKVRNLLQCTFLCVVTHHYDTSDWLTLEPAVAEAALLGVARSNWTPDHLPESLLHITPDMEGDKAGVLLSVLTLLRYYRVGGARTPQGAPPSVQMPDMDEPVCSEEAARLWRHIQALETGFPALELRWLEWLRSSGTVITPELLPDVLEAGRPAKMDALKPLIAAVSGARGQWLAQWNPAWQYIYPKDDARIWNEGTVGARVATLRRVREQAPARALEWLTQTWSREAVADRRRMAEVLHQHLSLEDEPFILEAIRSTLLQKNQSSAELRSTLLQLLLSLPNATGYAEWQTLVNQQWGTRSSSPVPLLPELEASWERLDTAGKIAHTPPEMLKTALVDKSDQWIEHVSNQGFLKALEASTIRFRSIPTARVLLDRSDLSDPYMLLPILPPAEREQVIMNNPMWTDWTQMGKCLHFHWTLPFSQWVLQQLYGSWSGYHFSRLQGILPLWVFLNKDTRPEDIPAAVYSSPVQREKWSQMIIPELNKLLLLKKQLWK